MGPGLLGRDDDAKLDAEMVVPVVVVPLVVLIDGTTQPIAVNKILLLMNTIRT